MGRGGTFGDGREDNRQEERKKKRDLDTGMEGMRRRNKKTEAFRTILLKNERNVPVRAVFAVRISLHLTTQSH